MAARSTIAYFVSSHGFGHAARAAAVIERLGRLAAVEFDLVTTTPDWFFAQSLTVPWRHVEAATDVGLVQTSAVAEDLDLTVELLEEFWARLPGAAIELAARWGTAPPRAVISDISPLGLEVGARLGVPSVLVENFTWDWIYEGFADSKPRLGEFGRRYAELASRATRRFQCQPVCRIAPAGVLIPPIARRSRQGRLATRRALGIDEADRRPLALFTMGGFGWTGPAPAGGREWLRVTLGGVATVERQPDVIRLPDCSPVYPPDLVAAADVVVAKLGYSTVAECFRSGTRLAFVRRESFRESPVLEEFALRHLTAAEIGLEDLESERWQRIVARLLDEPRREGGGENGDQILAARLARLVRGGL